MPAISSAPIRAATVAATWAGRRLRRRRTRREAIGEWWRRAKVALGIERPPRRLAEPPIPHLAAAAGVGAGGVLLVTFRRRAARLKDKATAAVHQVHSTETAPDNDQTLVDKVRTEIFRRPDAPKGAVNVSAVEGIVYLRGEVPSSEEIERLVDDTLAVTGVLRVENLLHTPGTPAPTDGAGQAAHP
jgi:hypothetical protein